MLRAYRTEALTVHVAWCMHGLQLPHDPLRVDGELIASPRQLLKLLRAGRGPTLLPAAVVELARAAELTLRPARPAT